MTEYYHVIVWDGEIQVGWNTFADCRQEAILNAKQAHRDSYFRPVLKIISCKKWSSIKGEE